jgi:hypothetical protein
VQLREWTSSKSRSLRPGAWLGVIKELARWTAITIAVTIALAIVQRLIFPSARVFDGDWRPIVKRGHAP